MNLIGNLRPIVGEELPLVLSWRNAPGVRANMYTSHEISIEEHLAWWARTSERKDQQYFMYERDGVPLGVVGITRIDTINSNCSWAFYADPAAPKGTGSRMEYLVLEHVFFFLGLHRLYCEVLDFNVPVQKLHAKFGFQVEGRLRQQHLHGEAYADIVLLGILATEWAGRRDAMFDQLTALQQR